MQALMLAAGMGKRLGKYTNGNTKCMLEVAGKRLIDRVIEALEYAKIHKFIIVTGYQEENLVNYILEKFKDADIKFEFINNEKYEITNNIYSLFLAKDYLELDDTILLESDLIFDKAILKKICKCHDSDVAVVAPYEEWMDGTVTLLDDNNNILEFVEKKDFNFQLKKDYYKTANIYKLSKEFSKNLYIPFLEAYIKAYGINEYYELVLKALAHLSRSGLKAFKLEDEKWYEIDDMQDLDIANALFSKGEEKLTRFTNRYGGYWRFKNVKDFCYLVNPYFPSENMINKMKSNYAELLTQYPSGMSIQSLNAARMFKVDEQEIIVGNGATEIINSLDNVLKGKVGVCIPTFNEYIRCFRRCEVVTIDTSKSNYQLVKEDLILFAKKVDNLVIVSPDNPSGSFLKYEEVIDIIEYCKKNNKRIIIDESFIDFADKEFRYTLINSEILNKYKNLIVIKSISKSYGVPGLRLGVVSTADSEILVKLKLNMSIWNINSFGEYFLQIINLYDKEYNLACDRIAAERNRFIGELSKLNYIKVYQSQANYVLCELSEGYKSKELAITMLEEKNVLIKDLGDKVTFIGKQFVRIAVRDKADNDFLLDILKNL